MKCDFHTVSLSHILIDEETYRITTQAHISDLAASVAQVGLINPPVLIPKGDNYAIISGFRRVAAVCQLGWQQSPARVLLPDTAHSYAAQIAIADNASQRPLNQIELSRAFTLLSSSMADQHELAKIAENLGLPNNPSLINKIKPLCRLPLAIQHAILSDIIALPVVQMLMILEEKTALALVAIFQTLKIGLNKQREMITLCREIALRDDVSIDSLLDSSSIQSVLKDPVLDRARKAIAIRNYLKQKRFPNLTTANDAFNAAIKSLKIGKHAGLVPPLDFEGMQYTLKLTFTNINELQQHKNTIDHISAHSYFNHLLNSFDS